MDPNDERPSLPSNGSIHHDALPDDSVEAASELDVQDVLHLLDQVWPRNDTDSQQMPRQFGRFTIESELGRGGFGIVYLAQDPFLKRRVALKLPRIGIVSDLESWRRFLREAQAAARLNHPNVIPLIDAGTIGPVGYIVSAYVAGPSLEQWLRHNRRPVSPRWSAQIVAALARAMEHAHQRKILHRDLKPANIVLYAPECDDDASNRRAWENGDAASWLPKICDFGMAKLLEAEGDETRSRIACGSPSYMAPEQAEARQSEIGPKTDVYGLGAILYQMLTGRPPFSGKNELDTLHQVVAHEPASPRTLRPDLPRDLETICSKCLSKRPEGRYESALALAEDLEAFLDGRPIKARPMAMWARGWKWARRRPAVASLAMAVSLAIVAGICGLLWHDAVLRDANHTIHGINAQLTGANQRLQEALDDKSHSARQLQRQLAVHRVFGAQLAFADEKFELAQRLLEEAEPELVSGDNPVFGWSYLRRRVRDRFEVLRGHSAMVSGFACSPDGRTLASGDEKGEVRLWDLETGRCQRVLADSAATYMEQLVFSPNGKLLAASNFDGRGISIWEVPAGRPIASIDAYKPGFAFKTISFARDRTRLVARYILPQARLTVTKAWDILPNGVVPVARAKLDPTMSAESPVGLLQRLADILDGDDKPAPPGRPDLSRPGRGRVIATRDFALTVTEPGDGSFAVYRTNDQTKLAAGRIDIEGTALVLLYPQVWNKQHLPGEQQRVKRLEGGLAPKPSASNNGPDLIFRAFSSDLVAFSADGRLMAIWRGNEKRTLEVIELTSGRQQASLHLGGGSSVRAISFIHGGTALAIGSGDRLVRIWKFQPTREPLVIRGHAPEQAWALAFSHDNRSLASGGDDHEIRIWDTTTGRELSTLSRHGSLVTSLAFSLDGRTLASGSFDEVRPVILWDVASGRPRFELNGHNNRVRAVALSRDARLLASAGDDLTLRLWSVRDGRLLHTYANRESRMNAVAVSPDGRTVACPGKDRRLVFTDTMTGASRAIETSYEPGALAFSPDGSRLYCASDVGPITIWDVANGEQVGTLPGHNSVILCLAVSPDGATLASAGDDSTVRLWDTVSGQELLCLTDCKARVNAVAFSPDGSTLAAADHSGAITLWRAGPAANLTNTPNSAMPTAGK
jgi:eukaryotic-like serine/threonine-protein kinase